MKLPKWLTRAPRPAFTHVPSTTTPGLSRLVGGPQAAREAQARQEARDRLAREPDRCWACYYGFLIRHARSEGNRGEWPLRLQEDEAAMDELRKANAGTCVCPEPGRDRQESHQVNAPWASHQVEPG